MGEVDLPDELKVFEARVKKLPFSDWRKLPEIIAEMDINLAHWKIPFLMKQNQKTNGWKRLWLRPLPLPVMWEHFMIVWKMRLQAFYAEMQKNGRCIKESH